MNALLESMNNVNSSFLYNWTLLQHIFDHINALVLERKSIDHINALVSERKSRIGCDIFLFNYYHLKNWRVSITKSFTIRHLDCWSEDLTLSLKKIMLIETVYSYVQM